MLVGYVLPGFIDMHAHWNGFSDRFPASSWELETFLAYGVTTMHKCVLPIPSSHPLIPPNTSFP